jgi:hypothetical protein
MAELNPEAATPTLEVLDPEAIDQILADLRGFGIADTEQMISLTVKGRAISLRLANLCVDDEIQALIANLELKGHAWVHQMRCDLLSRATTWINGVRVTEDMVAKDPLTHQDRPIRPLLRDLYLRWGFQVVLVLFKIYMVHCQNLEDNLGEQLPDSTIMTEVERRFMQSVADELKAVNVAAISDTLDVALADTPPAPQE